MTRQISQRFLDIVKALPLTKGIRVLEIGCGTGVAAREIVKRTENVYVLAIDRSEKAIDQAIKSSQTEIANGHLNFLQAKIESFELPEGKEPFDIAFAVRVGALDGRHPDLETLSLQNIKNVLKPNGRLFIDGGSPLKEVKL